MPDASKCERSERLGNEHSAAITYGQLGVLAQERQDFSSAELWYGKSLAIWERQGNEANAAGTHHQLGIVAQLRGDSAGAERQYLVSLAIWEKSGHEHGAAITYHQLGQLAAEKHHLLEAGRLTLRALAIFRKSDLHDAQKATRNFIKLHQLASPDEKRQLEALWNEAQMGPFPPSEPS